MPSVGQPSLLIATVRRSFTLGRFFLLYGLGISVVLGIVLNLAAGSAFASAFPFLVPIFATVGSLGALVVFTNDRIKGVFEYLLSYGISPRRIFLNTLISSLLLVSVVVAVAVGAGLGVYLARGHALTPQLSQLVGVYAIPMSYVSAAFATTIGMIWMSLSSPRGGMSSPLGLAPLMAILPPVSTLIILVVLGAEGLVSPNSLAILAIAMVTGIGASVVGMLLSTDRFLRREKLLSPA